MVLGCRTPSLSGSGVPMAPRHTTTASWAYGPLTISWAYGPLILIMSWAHGPLILTTSWAYGPLTLTMSWAYGPLTLTMSWASGPPILSTGRLYVPQITRVGFSPTPPILSRLRRTRTSFYPHLFIFTRLTHRNPSPFSGSKRVTSEKLKERLPFLGLQA